MVRSLAFLPTFCVGEQGTDHDVKQVEHVVLRARLQCPHEGEQRRYAPLQRHSRHGLGPGDGREPGERRYPAWRHVIDGRQAQRQPSDFVEPTHGTGQFGTAAQVWPVPKAVEWTGAAALASDEQGIELRTLFGCYVAGEGAPEAAGGSGADAGDQALKGRRPRQQHLLVTSQTVARSNSTLGRSVPVQHRA